MDGKKFCSVLTEYFCDYIISWMAKKIVVFVCFHRIFVGLHKNIFALLRHKKLTCGPYQYHFYNEARPIDFLRRTIRVFEFTQRMVSGWKTDRILVSDLERYVQENLRRCEILDFVKRVFPSYPWSLPTLAMRLSYFKISYIDASVDVEMVKNIVKMNSVALENCLDIGR